MRHEIPAVIVIDAPSIPVAMMRAEQLSEFVARESERGDPIFESPIGVIATDLPIGCEEDREEETVAQHVRSIRESG